MLKWSAVEDNCCVRGSNPGEGRHLDRDFGPKEKTRNKPSDTGTEKKT